jgi:ribosomal-protein-alanine N-acetyltransferase
MSTIEHLELYTERLTLKVLDESFATRVLDFFARNREFMREWNPALGGDFYTLAFHREKLRNELEMMRQGYLLRLHLFKRADSAFERVIGVVAFNNMIRGAFQSCHLGYQIDERETNQGLITEALRKAIEYGFDELKLHRVEANIMPRNARSRRVAEKLGFEAEGLAKKYLKIDGTWEDHLHYVLFNTALE